jgi:hypothetical protein
VRRDVITGKVIFDRDNVEPEHRSFHFTYSRFIAMTVVSATGEGRMHTNEPVEKASLPGLELCLLALERGFPGTAPRISANSPVLGVVDTRIG